MATGPIRSMHDILSNRCRRAILFYLQDQDEPVTTETLVRQLARWEFGQRIAESATVPEMLDHSDVYRTHIRQMADFDIIEYDRDSETVWIPDGVAITVSPPWDSTGEVPVRNRLADSTAPTNHGVPREGEIPDPGPQ